MSQLLIKASIIVVFISWLQSTNAAIAAADSNLLLPTCQPVSTHSTIHNWGVWSCCCCCCCCCCSRNSISFHYNVQQVKSQSWVDSILCAQLAIVKNNRLSKFPPGGIGGFCTVQRLRRTVIDRLLNWFFIFVYDITQWHNTSTEGFPLRTDWLWLGRRPLEGVCTGGWQLYRWRATSSSSTNRML